MASKLLLLRRLSSVLNSPSSFSLVRRSCLPSLNLLQASRPFDFSENTYVCHFLEASRSFCSRPLNLDDESQGPAAIDYGSLLQEDEYHRLADSTIYDLQEKFEEYGDSVQIDGFDIDYGNQVLTLKLGTLGTYVMNKQTPNRQIWLSSPVRYYLLTKTCCWLQIYYAYLCMLLSKIYYCILLGLCINVLRMFGGGFFFVKKFVSHLALQSLYFLKCMEINFTISTCVLLNGIVKAGYVSNKIYVI